MMDERKDGGAAFPRTWSESYGGAISNESSGGMSLRDWFAGQAMCGLYAASNGQILTRPEDLRADAMAAYAIADAMLAARKEEA